MGWLEGESKVMSLSQNEGMEKVAKRGITLNRRGEV
jgi:hypothetical protein